MWPHADPGASWEPVGAGWWLYTKSDGEGYVVKGFDGQCSCFGYKRWAHCKHIDWLEEYYEQRRYEQGARAARKRGRAA